MVSPTEAVTWEVDEVDEEGELEELDVCNDCELLVLAGVSGVCVCIGSGTPPLIAIAGGNGMIFGISGIW